MPPDTTQAPAPASEPRINHSNTYNKNRTVARKAGVAPVRRGDPGCEKHPERESDGIGCELLARQPQLIVHERPLLVNSKSSSNRQRPFLFPWHCIDKGPHITKLTDSSKGKASRTYRTVVACDSEVAS